MQRWASILAAVAVVGVVGYLTLGQLEKPIPHVWAEDAGDDAGVADAALSPDASTETTAEAGAPLDTDAGLSLLGFQIDAGTMPTSAPRSVKLGVVLVQFAGAEGATTSRSKADALKRARELSDQAKTDFKAAVKGGDTGSSENMGSMPRGVLEAPIDIAVFSLAAGEVSDPLDTPRGYWVVKRLE